MNDHDFLDAFENCTLADFHHRDHVRLAWLYLRQEPLPGALLRFTTGLRRFATAAGSPGLYHETITWAFLFVIHERMRQSDRNWDEFCAANEDLLRWKPSVLERYYRPETLASAEARTWFVMPDRVPEI